MRATTSQAVLRAEDTPTGLETNCGSADEFQLTAAQGFGSAWRLMGTLDGDPLRPPQTEPDMSRLHAIVALLVATTALAAAPALAAGATAGAHGSGAVNRAAPEVLVLPGKAKAKKLPLVDLSVSRGLFDATSADALQSLGTVTFSRDGSTTEAPASDALRGIFEEESKGHHS
jgi:hypothetical protein